MTISIYHIQNIIRTYNKQLHLEGKDKTSSNAGAQEIDDPVQISLEGRKRQLFQQITQEVRGRIISKDRKANDEDT